MSNAMILATYEKLPNNLKKKFELYVDFLFKFHQREEAEKNMTAEETKNKNRVFGIAKGMFNMKDNFDEPLDEFKDYM
jgi:hypothetical protein